MTKSSFWRSNRFNFLCNRVGLMPITVEIETSVCSITDIFCIVRRQWHVLMKTCLIKDFEKKLANISEGQRNILYLYDFCAKCA